MTMMDLVRSGLWEPVELAPPADAGPLVVCADWCDERDAAALAYALRWCAAHKRRPHHRTDVRRIPFQWIRHQLRYDGRLSRRKVEHRRAAVVPRLVFDTAPSDQCESSHATRYEAYIWLARALAKLRVVVEMPSIVLPPAPVVVRLGPVTCADCGIMRERERERCPVCNCERVKP